jgi:hypothetical protein
MVQIGTITVDNKQVGVISADYGDGATDTFMPDLDGYEPMGRAAPGEAPIREPGRHRPGHHPGATEGPSPSQDGTPKTGRDQGRGHWPGHRSSDQQPHRDDEPTHKAPRGDTYDEAGVSVRRGSAETDAAIVEAAKAHNLDPNMMRSIASIESGMNPSSNANRSTQYKGLYQIGRNEWERFGEGGNVYSAKENAMGAARMFAANRAQFQKRFGRDPTDTEYYLMHQQGLGFYTRGAMTNISGNPYPGMRGAQTHEQFEAGWGREVARRKAGFAKSQPKIAETKPMPPVQGLE